MAKAKTKEDQEMTTVPALVVTPQKMPTVSGNFEQVEAYLVGWQQKVSSVKITEDNIEEVRAIKREAVTYRNSLDKIQASVRREYFKNPQSVIDAKFAHLQSLVAQVENTADAVLSKEEEERVVNLTQIFDMYKAKFQESYHLEDEYLSQVEYKKQYYNKTAVEKESKNDIEEQFKTLLKEQKAHAANIRLIKSMCADEPRLNVQIWIDKLAYDDVATISEAIVEEKKRLRELDNPKTETAQEESETVEVDAEVVGGESEDFKTVVLGSPSTIDFTSDFKGRRKGMDIHIEYNVDQGDALSELFKMLKSYGITTKQITKEEVF